MSAHTYRRRCSIKIVIPPMAEVVDLSPKTSNDGLSGRPVCRRCLIAVGSCKGTSVSTLKLNIAAVHPGSEATRSARSCRRARICPMKSSAGFRTVELGSLTCPTTVVLMDRAKGYGTVKEKCHLW